MEFVDVALVVPKILLPSESVDKTKWAVVACDQYTSDKGYWAEVEKTVGKESSTLRLIYPEAYLKESEKEKDERISKINAEMNHHISSGIVEEHGPCFVLLDRKTNVVESRKGLIFALDLNEYEYEEGKPKRLIRSSEGTIADRLPPRVAIRENAPLELPHIMVLIDDRDKTVIEPLFERLNEMEKLYDFDLMKDGGHVAGYKVEKPELLNQVVSALRVLRDPTYFREKYGASKDEPVLLYAMGDGNHSFATAKKCWVEKQKKGATAGDAARFALVELVNIHDAGLSFEPIYRVCEKVNWEDMMTSMKSFYAKEGSEFSFYKSGGKEAAALNKEGVHVIRFVVPGVSDGYMEVKGPKRNLEVGTLQAFLDVYIDEKNADLDYVHKDEEVELFGNKEDGIGFFLPPMEKTDFFKTIVLDGALPRKTFSMGHADEKRFYIEGKKIQ